ncbi:molybdopterin-dependent oxidoreductase [Conexibacter sp. DBS9H8]|uniref:molybdopterin-dependent oxidoreductase n=1 Tax=Conexibacter sp. DBS9H8 TaxID=2937801 RepID=UPI002113687F|nr:molybdopterin-dependent oxidoreductase [Conexibacter sp. DBS9H8]
MRPGGDVFLLLGMLHTLFREDLGGLAGRVDGVPELAGLAANWPPARTAARAGVAADTISRLAHEFAAAASAVAYGRVGVCHQRTGTLTHWLINALNILTANVDSPGGAMFPTPAIDGFGVLGTIPLTRRWGHRHQRVSGLPGYADELPMAGLADEILTPGEGQVRGLVTYAGHPVLSTPQGARLDEALAGLEHYIAVDFYVTETTHHAHVILPPVSHLERADVDFVFPSVSVHNHIRANRRRSRRRPAGRPTGRSSGARGADRPRRARPSAAPGAEARHRGGDPGAARRPRPPRRPLRPACPRSPPRTHPRDGETGTPRDRPRAADASPARPARHPGDARPPRPGGDAR